MHSHIDYAYPWYLSSGHLLAAAIGLAASILLWKFKSPKLLLALAAAFTLWAASAAALIKTGLDLNGPMPMPTANFLAGRQGGRILDMGAGTGRSSIMILEARPQSTLVALDLFTQQYEAHFGKDFSGQEKLLANFQAAGVDGRAAIQAGDMRKLPFEAAEFDGIVSSYAIDHLNRGGIKDALDEAFRVLKPGGEFLMMVIAKDRWLSYTFGPLLLHAQMRGSSTWPELLKASGFQVVEQGTRPATLYYLARKDGKNQDDFR